MEGHAIDGFYGVGEQGAVALVDEAGGEARHAVREAREERTGGAQLGSGAGRAVREGAARRRGEFVVLSYSCCIIH